MPQPTTKRINRNTDGRNRGRPFRSEAGSKGNFGLVIGIARKGNAEELKRHGAHLVVRDLVELMD